MDIIMIRPTHLMLTDGLQVSVIALYVATEFRP